VIEERRNTKKERKGGWRKRRTQIHDMYMYIDRQMIGKIDFQDSKTRAQQFIRG